MCATVLYRVVKLVHYVDDAQLTLFDSMHSARGRHQIIASTGSGGNGVIVIVIVRAVLSFVINLVDNAIPHLLHIARRDIHRFFIYLQQQHRPRNALRSQLPRIVMPCTPSTSSTATVVSNTRAPIGKEIVPAAWSLTSKALVNTVENVTIDDDATSLSQSYPPPTTEPFSVVSPRIFTRFRGLRSARIPLPPRAHERLRAHRTRRARQASTGLTVTWPNDRFVTVNIPRFYRRRRAETPIPLDVTINAFAMQSGGLREVLSVDRTLPYVRARDVRYRAAVIRAQLLQLLGLAVLTALRFELNHVSLSRSHLSVHSVQSILLKRSRNILIIFHYVRNANTMQCVENPGISNEVHRSLFNYPQLKFV